MNKPFCFGNFTEGENGCREDYWNCKFQLKCLNNQNIHKGKCDCKYKVCCHVGRQHVRTMFPDVEQNVDDCWFYKRFEEKLTSEEKLKYLWKEEE